MIRQFDYKKLQHELLQKYNSENKTDQFEIAYHYGHFGFNAIAAKYLKLADKQVPYADDHLAQLDSFYNTAYPSAQLRNKFRYNQDFSKLKTFQIVCPYYDDHNRETDMYVFLIPFIQALRTKYSNIETVYFDCKHNRLQDLFKKYFPFIHIGTASIAVSSYDVMDEVKKLGGAALLRAEILKISHLIRGIKQPQFVGINWFSNAIWEKHRSIPIGTLINTVGAHENNLQVMSLQYNNLQTEIDIYNRYAKNKIIQTFDNDINTSVLDMVNAVSQCRLVIGIQSEVLVLACSLLGIPSLVTANSPVMRWYLESQLNPFVQSTVMRFIGDHEYVCTRINKFLSDHNE